TYTPGVNGAPGTLSSDPGASATQIATDLANLLQNDYFVPTNYDTDHQTFYGYSGGDEANGSGTLMHFVQAGVQGVADKFAHTAIAGLTVTPGVELVNPDAHINNGNISILSNWNLGAGDTPDSLAFRFNGLAPIITFRAENNVDAKASLTDGFFQLSNPIARG